MTHFYSYLVLQNLILDSSAGRCKVTIIKGTLVGAGSEQWQQFGNIIVLQNVQEACKALITKTCKTARADCH